MQLVTRYPAMISHSFGGYAAASGAAGLIGAFVYTLFTTSFGVRPAAVISIVGAAPMLMVATYSCVLQSVEEVHRTAAACTPPSSTPPISFQLSRPHHNLSLHPPQQAAPRPTASLVLHGTPRTPDVPLNPHHAGHPPHAPLAAPPSTDHPHLPTPPSSPFTSSQTSLPAPPSPSSACPPPREHTTPSASLTSCASPPSSHRPSTPPPPPPPRRRSGTLRNGPLGRTGDEQHLLARLQDAAPPPPSGKR